MYTHQSLPSRSAPAWVLAACVALLVNACGGGSTTSPQTIDVAVTNGSSGTSAPPWSTADMPADAAGLIAQPAFHLAPVFLLGFAACLSVTILIVAVLPRGAISTQLGLSIPGAKKHQKAARDRHCVEVVHSTFLRHFAYAAAMSQ